MAEKPTYTLFAFTHTKLHHLARRESGDRRRKSSFSQSAGSRNEHLVVSGSWQHLHELIRVSCTTRRGAMAIRVGSLGKCRNGLGLRTSPSRSRLKCFSVGACVVTPENDPFSVSASFLGESGQRPVEGSTGNEDERLGSMRSLATYRCSGAAWHA